MWRIANRIMIYVKNIKNGRRGRRRRLKKRRRILKENMVKKTMMAQHE